MTHVWTLKDADGVRNDWVVELNAPPDVGCSLLGAHVECTVLEVRHDPKRRWMRVRYTDRTEEMA